ncbi:Bug family tripartite tricarboxylate transporter substrate binding protein [Pigmentiphaga litoralis]|uniref:Tripartite-type tricarboxylate transporter receptor subunit TctC n=1 Tax=Pigmentiphaga litoralis TaxID=516702 RepID=A0A7Y9IWH6_9BURK|nr:tripartite tricarboxylate transporter substrate binding protein [Pigmentiphaga litoralis]NYE22005.1 tripartite-type tricarboxylate transporter receptor subunit TctC [Pigmentiphaga litoralis]NYE84380.1 tripartite-type tricarboxylate transporter receptor subunit TctC [Pigmentiphaga litoralis]
MAALPASRHLLALALATLCALPATQALAQGSGAADGYPNHAITLVNPYAAGGPADILARALARQLETRLKQTIVVENKPGGGATVGGSVVARAKPDGYTLLLGTSATHVVTPLMEKIAYDGIGDFTFVSVVANQPIIMVASPALPANTLKEVIAAAKASPGKLNFGSAGAGGATHLAGELLKQRAGINLTHIPYPGAVPALKDVIGGQVQLAMLNLSATQAFLKEGRIKAIAYAAAQRSPLFPDVPTFAEAGVTGAESSTWYTLAAPKGTPPAIIDTLNKAVAAVNADPEYQKFMATQGVELMTKTPAETLTFVQHDLDTMKPLLKSLNLTAP